MARRTLWRDFRFPRSGNAQRQLEGCHALLQARCGEVGHERLTDFCISQVYAMSRFGTSYRSRWKVAHSFGERAVGRYLSAGRGMRYREDRWLEGFGLSRAGLLDEMEDRSTHPYARFVYPEYEERTKRRLLSTEAGYTVCALSTLLWTPLSPSCRQCVYAEKCRQRTASRYPELYRLRLETLNKEKMKS